MKLRLARKILVSMARHDGRRYTGRQKLAAFDRFERVGGRAQQGRFIERLRREGMR